jgi:hypothetical protein
MLSGRGAGGVLRETIAGTAMATMMPHVNAIHAMTTMKTGDWRADMGEDMRQG